MIKGSTERRKQTGILESLIIILLPAYYIGGDGKIKEISEDSRKQSIHLKWRTKGLRKFSVGATLDTISKKTLG